MTQETTTPVKVKEFQPPSVQDYNSRYPGFAHRLVDKNQGNRRGDRLQYWLNQGWEIAPYGNAGMKGNRPTGASAMDKAVHYRGLVLVRIAKPAADARNEHYRGKHKRIMSAMHAMRDMAAAVGEDRRNKKRHLASAFAEVSIRKGKKVLEESDADTRHGDREKIMRDVDPAALRELQERMGKVLANQEKLEKQNEELRRELAERSKRPSDRQRKSFPVS
jgi:hypothetical protein